MKKLLFLMLAIFNLSISKGQVRTPTLYVTGTVSSDEKMLVSFQDTKTTKTIEIKGEVVSAEVDGKITEAKIDKKGYAVLDFSLIAGDLVNPTVAVIKVFDKNGNLLSSTKTTVQKSISNIPARPVIEQLPKNLSNGEAVTIPGKHLGTDAKLFCGNQEQETLAASSNELIVFTNAKTGIQPVYVVTPNGVSESQKVNFYSLDFSLPKSSIKPRENVQATVNYESIPAGTKLIFTNKSPETIKITIPGAENAANESVYTVADKNGSIPVNITGLIRGNFTIALDYDFKNERKDSIPPVFYDEKPPVPPNPKEPKDQEQPPVQEKPKTLADTLKIKDDIIKRLEEISRLLEGELVTGEGGGKVKTDNMIGSLNAAIAKEKEIIAAEKGILSDRRFSNVLSGDPKYNPDYDKTHQNPGNMQKAKDNIEKALEQENKALQNKNNAATELSKLNILIPNLKNKISRAKAGEIAADKLKNGSKAEQEKAKGLTSDAERNEKEAIKELDGALKSLNDILIMITEADAATNKAIEFKNDALINFREYTRDSKSEKDLIKAREYRNALERSRNKLVDDEKVLKSLLGDIDKLQKLGNSAKEGLGKIVK